MEVLSSTDSKGAVPKKRTPNSLLLRPLFLLLYVCPDFLSVSHSKLKKKTVLILIRVQMQVSNDRYGRKNTIARFLLRIALSSDMLEERPNSWPRPPGGFSSTRVLGPQSDLISSSPPKNLKRWNSSECHQESKEEEKKARSRRKSGKRRRQ